jgi:hypothetical protein
MLSTVLFSFFSCSSFYSNKISIYNYNIIINNNDARLPRPNFSAQNSPWERERISPKIIDNLGARLERVRYH